MSVATNIRNHRLRRGLTQKKLAALVGKNWVTITKYELGQIDIPLSVLEEIVKVRRRESRQKKKDLLRRRRTRAR
jgi:predicted transcriptional regulator